MKTSINPIKNESGQSLTEYALIISLIILATLGAVQALGFKVKDLYTLIVNNLPF